MPVLVTPEEVPELGERLETVTDEALAERMAQTSVELLVRFAGRDGTPALLGRIDGLFRGFLASGRLEVAATLAEDLRKISDEGARTPELRAQIDETLTRMATSESVRRWSTRSHAAAPAPSWWRGASSTRWGRRRRAASCSRWPRRRTSRGAAGSSSCSCPWVP